MKKLLTKFRRWLGWKLLPQEDKDNVNHAIRSKEKYLWYINHPDVPQ